MLHFFRRPVRVVGVLVLFAMPAACAFCIPTEVHPLAEENTKFGLQYYAEDQLVQAEARCKLAIEYSPKYAQAWNCIGLIEHKRGRLELAMEHFKRAIAYFNDFSEAYNNLGAIFVEMREYLQAEDMFRQSIEIDPGFVSARVNLAQTLYYQNRPDEAHEQYLRCIELDPNACDCHLGMGVIATDKQAWDQGRTHYQKMAEVCPDSPEAHYNLGFTYYNLARCADAVDAFISALAKKADHIEASKGLVAAYDCLGKQDGAVMEYMTKIRAAPGDPEPHFKLAAVYEKRKDHSRALNEYLNAIKLDDKKAFLEAYYRAARIFDQQMQTQETISHCQAFVDQLRDDRLATEKSWCVDRVKQLQYQQ